MYRPITYLVAKLTEELIIALGGSLVFCCLTFFPMLLPGSFLLYFLVYYLTTCIGIGTIVPQSRREICIPNPDPETLKSKT